MEQVRIASLDVTLKSAIRNLKSAILAGALPFALYVPAGAQQAGNARIGYLDPSTRSSSAGYLETFRHEMSKLGWIEGKNIIIDYRFAEQEPKRLANLAAELVSLKVDVILGSSTPPVLAAKNATTTIPIVMAVNGDALASGLVGSLARPGGNITGLTSFTGELAGKRLEILKETVPKLTRVGVVWFSGGPGVSQRLQLKQIRAAALALNLKLEEIELDPQDLEGAFQTAMRKVNAIIMASAAVIFAERKRIVELASKYRLPAAYSDDAFVDEGGLLSYGNDRVDQYRRAAVYVDKILRGTKPADLPVERPTKFELSLILKRPSKSA
jgi:putative tryptophan/tyrosine transport system substrate-binding protein